MVTFYEEMQGVATEILEEFKQGQVYLVAQTITPGDEAWEAGTPETHRYLLKSAVKPVDRRWVGTGTIVATDVEVVCAVTAQLVAEDGTLSVASIEPTMEDLLVVDDRQRGIKKLTRVPEAGTAVAFRMVVEG